MRNSRVATRYAKALLLLSSEAGTLEEAYGDMKLLVSVLKESKDLKNLLKSPIIKTDKKTTILTKIFENKISTTSMIFINTITTKKRESLLQVIAESFIKNYKKYCEIVKPDAVCIDYEVNPIEILKNINIPIQGGMNPKILLTDKDNLKKEAKRYLDIFKDHPYIFNLGHGVLPETDPGMMDYLVKMVKDY